MLDGLRALEDAFPAQPGQCGALLGLGADLCPGHVSRPDAALGLHPPPLTPGGRQR
jgi:hypothetical protein